MSRLQRRYFNNNESYPKQLLAAIRKFLPQRGLPLIEADHRVRWTDRILVITAIVMTWADSTMQTDAFTFAHDFVIRMYPTRRRPGRQYRGFISALSKKHDILLKCVCNTLRDVMCKRWLDHKLLGAWVVMSVDGSRVAVPRTVSNEEGFGVFGKDKSCPQQQLTTVFHVVTNLLWAWRRDRGDVSERTHLREMIDELPSKTLLLADAGFTGYQLLCQLQDAGHNFIIRVGSNVRLLRKLNFAVREYRGIVYLWPQGKRKNKPLILRLVTVRDGCKRVDLLSDVLDEKLLSNADIAALYRGRWGIEIMYRSVKHTMGNRKLRSRIPRHAQIELDWVMVGFWLLGLLTMDAAGEARTINKNRSWSPAQALRVVRYCIVTPRQKTRHLRKLLGESLQDVYQRIGPKRTRASAQKKRESPPGQPKLRTAKIAEVLAAQRFKPCNMAS